MAVFKYELRQIRSYTIWWAVTCAVAIYAMLPTYASMLSSAANIETIGLSGIFDLLGVDPTYIGQPIGVFGFLNAFFSIAAGISGMFLGLKTFTKETIGRSAEFIYTKPVSRGFVYLAKVKAGFVASLIIGMAYFLGSLAAVQGFANMDVPNFILITLSFTLIEVFFLLFGAMIGVLIPKIRTPLLLSAGVVFVFYVFSAFASKVGASAIQYLTPFSYFGASKIIHSGGYDLGYMTAYVLFFLLFLAIGYMTFRKKDITLIS